MLGFAASGLVFAYYSDKYGRRPITWLCLLIEIMGIILSGLSPNIYMYGVSRFLTGLGSSGRWLSVNTMSNFVKIIALIFKLRIY